MAIEIISRSISTKLLDRIRIELATPGSAVRLATGTSKQTFQLVHLLVDNTFQMSSHNWFLKQETKYLSATTSMRWFKG